MTIIVPYKSPLLHVVSGLNSSWWVVGGVHIGTQKSGSVYLIKTAVNTCRSINA